MKSWLVPFFTALGFLTRLKMPAWVPFDADSVARSTRWFATVGLVVGGVGALVLYLAAPLLGQPCGALLALLAMVLLTGAFHEDGLADLCDGFWGGWERERKLAIMKDSMIGTYGVLALVFAFAFKLLCLVQLDTATAALALVVVHGGSRVVSGWLPRWLPYARIGSNKTPQRERVPAHADLLFLSLTGLAPLLLVPSELVWSLLIAWLLTYAGMAALMRQHIQGYTGDTLGATQQVAEIVGLLVFTGHFLN